MFFSSRPTISVKPEVYEKVKKYCEDNRLGISEFVEEAVIEKMIEKNIKKK